MRITTAAFALTATAMARATAAGAETYIMQSAFSANLPVLGPAADRFVERVALLADGEVDLKHSGECELSPPFEIFDNVGIGAIDAGFSQAAGKTPAAALFGSIPFGGSPVGYVSWPTTAAGSSSGARSASPSAGCRWPAG